jgi:Ion channel
MPNRSTALKHIPGAVRGRLALRRHTALLVAIIMAFAVRPLIGDTGLATATFSIALVGLVIVALYNIQVDELVGERKALVAERKRWLVVAWVLAAVAIVERVTMLTAPIPWLVVTGTICWLLLFSLITLEELRAVLRQKQVTSETISMAISVYLLIGITWGLLYILLYEVQPGAFSFGGSPVASSSTASRHQSVFPVLTYFSLVTLATVGYGEIAPVSLQARYLAVAEGITGQFYLAILVARLVAMQMGQTAARQVREANDRSEATTSGDGG